MIHECVEILNCNSTAFMVLEKEPLIVDISMYLEALQCEVATRGTLFPKTASLTSGIFLQLKLSQGSAEGQKQRPREGAQGVLGSQQDWSGKGRWAGIWADKSSNPGSSALSAIKKKKIKILLTEEGRGEVQTGIIRAVPKNSRAVTSPTLLNEAFAEQDSKLNILFPVSASDKINILVSTYMNI